MIRRVIAALMLLLAGTVATAQVPFPQTLPANTVYGRLGISAGPGQAIPFSVLTSNLTGSGTGIFGLKLSGDTNYAMVALDRTVLINAALTAPRTVTLMAAATIATGQQICIEDAFGGVTSTNTLTLTRAGSDTINGATSYVINTPFGGVCLISDGASKWTRTNSIQLNTVTNALAAQMPANTIKGNNTGSTANAADLTQSQVTGMLPSDPTPGGRCTLSTLTPIMASSFTAQTTVFYTPYKSQLVPIYDGTNWVMVDVGGELSQTTTDATKSPAAVANNSVYDVFVWNDNGTFRATRGPVWSSSSSRGASATIFRLKGVYTNLNSITNGPAAQRGTYVCTIASNGTASIDFTYGGSGSGGAAGRFMVWNQYNRVLISSFVFDNGTSYTYSSATIRQARASTGNQIAFLVGNTEDSFSVWTQSFLSTAAAVNAFSLVGMGLDSNTVFTSADILQSQAAAALKGSGKAYWSALAGIGPHTASRIEQGDGTNTNTMANFGGDQITFQFPM